MLAKIGKSKFVFVVESQSINSGLGTRFGTWLLNRGYTPKYSYIGTHLFGIGGMGEQVEYQGLDPASIKKTIKELIF
jgi:transketolase C-terminal domain/subunit